MLCLQRNAQHKDEQCQSQKQFKCKRSSGQQQKLPQSCKRLSELSTVERADGRTHRHWRFAKSRGFQLLSPSPFLSIPLFLIANWPWHRTSAIELNRQAFCCWLVKTARCRAFLQLDYLLLLPFWIRVFWKLNLKTQKKRARRRKLPNASLALLHSVFLLHF